MVGRERFRQYLLPVYARLKDRISATGKLLAVHMDGRLESLMEEVAMAQIDIIEALTYPPGMGDVSIAEARRQWPNKALWLNFTSSYHIESPEIIEAHTGSSWRKPGTREASR